MGDSNKRTLCKITFGTTSGLEQISTIAPFILKINNAPVADAALTV
jgi:hypothetical protein